MLLNNTFTTAQTEFTRVLYSIKQGEGQGGIGRLYFCVDRVRRL